MGNNRHLAVAFGGRDDEHPSMLAMRLTSTGASPRLDEIAEPPADVAGSHGRVLAAAINPSDILRSTIVTTDANRIIGETAVPRTVGTEAVLALDDGRRVYAERAVVPYGMLAQRAVGREDALFELPDEISDEIALACGIAGLAGWIPVARTAELRAGESVLVLGATGAAGSVAVAAARLLGAGVVCAAGRRPAALESLRAGGHVDRTVLLTGSRSADASALARAAGARGFDVIIDFLFGDALAAALTTTAPLARVVCVGMSAGPRLCVDGMDLLVRGVRLLPYSNVLTPKFVRAECHRELLTYVAAGLIPVHIETYSLRDAERAWQRQADGAPGAKLVVIPDSF